MSDREHIVFKNQEIVCLRCSAEKTVMPLPPSKLEVVCEPFIETHMQCKETAFRRFWGSYHKTLKHGTPFDIARKIALDAWQACNLHRFGFIECKGCGYTVKDVHGYCPNCSEV